ncbi:MAG: TonB-dependent receptor [Bacteroidales bacterium]|nr:TonB-dependent receptor [Bacteroidales bacterium]MCF8388759.1 TonB-dependent receptor [Bacteroidales bacterium]
MAAFLEHKLETGKLHLSAGLLANWNSNYAVSVYPGLDIAYRLTRNFRLIASINKSLRLPSYTDLYYEGPTNTGNPNLKPEESLTFESGIKFYNQKISGELIIFHRLGENIIDWVKPNDTAKWQSRNLTSLQTTGVQTSVNFRHPFQQGILSGIHFIRISYTYISMQKSSEDYISKYALDQLKHKLVFTLQHKIYRGFGASWMLDYQDRNGSYFDYAKNQEHSYDPFFLANVKLFWKRENINIYLEIANIFDTDYFDHGNVMMPGRWIKGGVSYGITL